MRSNTKTQSKYFISSSIITKDDYKKLNEHIEKLNRLYEQTNSDKESDKIEKELN